MPLIECPDCHKKISEAAPTCPHCGRPMKGVHTTIEKTAKQLKVLLLACGAILALGLLMAFVGFSASSYGLVTTGVVVLILGLIGYCGTKIAIWWYHG